MNLLDGLRSFFGISPTTTYQTGLSHAQTLRSTGGVRGDELPPEELAQIAASIPAGPGGRVDRSTGQVVAGAGGTQTARMMAEVDNAIAMAGGTVIPDLPPTQQVGAASAGAGSGGTGSSTR